MDLEKEYKKARGLADKLFESDAVQRAGDPESIKKYNDISSIACRLFEAWQKEKNNEGEREMKNIPDKNEAPYKLEGKDMSLKDVTHNLKDLIETPTRMPWDEFEKRAAELEEKCQEKQNEAQKAADELNVFFFTHLGVSDEDAVTPMSVAKMVRKVIEMETKDVQKS